MTYADWKYDMQGNLIYYIHQIEVVLFHIAFN